MSDYICDICSSVTARSEVEFHSAAKFHDAVRDGLNPWKTPGFNMSLSAALGLDPDELYQTWRLTALVDTTDWGLCPTCTRAVSNATGRR